MTRLRPSQYAHLFQTIRNCVLFSQFKHNMTLQQDYHAVLYLPAFILYKTFYITILNLLIQYFSHSKSHHLPWLRVGPVVTCWVHCSSNEIICPTDPPHREGDMSITGPNSIYFTLSPCGKHRVLGQTSSVFVRVTFYPVWSFLWYGTLDVA